MKGCQCRKSRCLKKYCECYLGGVACTEACRCPCSPPLPLLPLQVIATISSPALLVHFTGVVAACAQRSVCACDEAQRAPGNAVAPCCAGA